MNTIETFNGLFEESISYALSKAFASSFSGRVLFLDAGKGFDAYKAFSHSRNRLTTNEFLQKIFVSVPADSSELNKILEQPISASALVIFDLLALFEDKDFEEFHKTIELLFEVSRRMPVFVSTLESSKPEKNEMIQCLNSIQLDGKPSNSGRCQKIPAF